MTFRLCTGLLCILLLGGCASTDATRDVASSAALAAHGLPTTPDWLGDWSQPSGAWDGAEPLTADVAVIVAMQNNPALRRDVLNIVASRADVAQAHLLPNPMFSIVLGQPIDGGGGDPGSIGFVQALTDLWRRPVRIDAAELRLRTDVLAAADAALELASRVRLAHADIVFNAREHELHRENHALASRSHELVERQFSAGDATALDVNEAALAMHATSLQMASAELALDSARRQLLQLIGWASHDASFSVTSEPLVRTALSEDEAVAAASANRLDVQASLAAAERAAIDVELAKLGKWPMLDGGVMYQQNFANRRAIAPTIRISPPILDDASARIALAAARAEQAVLEAERMRQVAVTEVRIALVERDHLEHLTTLQEQKVLDLATTDAALARRAFEAGTIGATRLIDAERAVMRARIELNTLQKRLHRAHVALERALGCPGGINEQGAHHDN